MHFILATTNQGKVKEISTLFGESHKIETIADIGFTTPIIEDGKTFEENAIIKAKAISAAMSEKIKNCHIIADDSGLMINALDGEPGVNSAIWLGENTSYEIRNQKILELLAEKEAEKENEQQPRQAEFKTVIVCITPDGDLITAEGTLKGLISHEAKGTNGFGYDPVFLVPELGRTLAELSTEEKNRISHRAKAIQEIAQKVGVIL